MLGYPHSCQSNITIYTEGFTHMGDAIRKQNLQPSYFWTMLNYLLAVKLCEVNSQSFVIASNILPI
jgi:hypothetical protein